MTTRNVLSLVNRRGQEVTLRKPNYGAYNPETGTTQGNSFQNYTVKAYFAEYMLSEIDNDSILMGDRKCLFPAEDTSGDSLPEPDAEDIVIGAGDRVVVKSVQKIYNGSQVVAYICQVRE